MALKVFSLEGRGLKLDTAADIEAHIGALREDDGVEEVQFHGNTLGVEACEALAKVLESKMSLQIANLADIFTARLLSEIPPALSALLTSLLTLPQLHTINLSDNAFGLKTVAPLQSFLSQHTPLQHLILNNNGLGPAAGTLVAEALTSLATKKEEARKAGEQVLDLETVVCGRNRLENGSMEAWARAYQAHKNMRSVKMVQNGIRQEGISYLLQNGLSQCTKLQVLDLQDNTFTSMGARALSDVVGRWTGLQELGVGDCLLGAKGGTYLANALKAGSNKSLEILRLQYNEIDAKSLEQLSHAASSLPQLRRIELNGNKFSDEDAALERLKELLDDRREAAGPGFEEGVDENWGIDELDDLEDESDEEDEVVSEDEGKDAERVVKEADEAEEENVPLEEDERVDELADILKKAEI
ncbi:Ran GAP Rna1 [Elasticomyces elasticus]|nr:Ran GAP Rna1 [Elasticomyces elasticus]